jgi:hypothetical protein
VDDVYCLDRAQFFHSPVDGHLSCLVSTQKFLAFMNNFSVTVGIQVFCKTVFLFIRPEREFFESYLSVSFLSCDKISVINHLEGGKLI